jgi:hypothetical protein
VASARMGSVGLPDDALVSLEGSSPTKQRVNHQHEIISTESKNTKS